MSVVTALWHVMLDGARWHGGDEPSDWLPSGVASIETIEHEHPGCIASMLTL
jgi:hypothetical protein